MVTNLALTDILNLAITDNPPPAVADTADEQSNGGAFRQLNNSQELDDRIIGGVAVKPHTIPWQAGLFVGLNICGGTILCPKFVMTAGHCVVDSNPRYGHYSSFEVVTRF